jgi:hypothetical protein
MWRIYSNPDPHGEEKLLKEERRKNFLSGKQILFTKRTKK